jgi:hypothetical protein
MTLDGFVVPFFIGSSTVTLFFILRELRKITSALESIRGEELYSLQKCTDYMGRKIREKQRTDPDPFAPFYSDPWS